MTRQAREQAARDYLERHFIKHGFRISGSLHRPITKIVDVIGLEYSEAARITKEVMQKHLDKIFNQIGEDKNKNDSHKIQNH